MQKRVLAIGFVLVCCFSLAGCLCRHEWSAALCDAPSTCTKCGETEGEALGHTWAEASCTEAKSCSRCGITEGEAMGHDWTEADCENAPVCGRCGASEGEALGHNWQDATTEAPKTCLRCADTEGEPIITDPRFKTANAAELMGKWAFETAIPPEAVGLAGYTQPLNIRFIVDFAPDGSLCESARIVDEETVTDAVVKYSVELAYLQMESQGISRETFDALIQDSYGMNMYDFVKSTTGASTIKAVMDNITNAVELDGVYYVEDGALYTGLTWESPMTPSDFTIDDKGLWVAGFDTQLGSGSIFRPVTGE